MEVSSKSVEQHVGRSDQTVYSVRECWVSQELLAWLILWTFTFLLVIYLKKRTKYNKVGRDS